MADIHTTASRRINIEVPGGRIGVSLRPGVTDTAARAEMLRVLESVERGFARRIVSIDNPSTLSTAASYVEMWARVAWRATFGLVATNRRIRVLRGAITAA